MARKNKLTKPGESERVTVYLPPAVVKALKWRAIQEGKTYSDLAAELLDAHFKKNPLK